MGKKRGSMEALCARRLRVLANSSRLSVVELLMKGPRHVGGLRRALGLEQSLLSHHLQVLRRAGLVEAARDGKTVRYRLTPAVRSRGAGRSINLDCCQLRFS